MQYKRNKFTVTVVSHDRSENTATDDSKPYGSLAVGELKEKATVIINDAILIPFHSVMLATINMVKETVDKNDSVCISGGGGKSAVVGNAVVGSAIVGNVGA